MRCLYPAAMVVWRGSRIGANRPRASTREVDPCTSDTSSDSGPTSTTAARTNAGSGLAALTGWGALFTRRPSTASITSARRTALHSGRPTGAGPLASSSCTAATNPCVATRLTCERGAKPRTWATLSLGDEPSPAPNTTSPSSPRLTFRSFVDCAQRAGLAPQSPNASASAMALLRPLCTRGAGST